MMLIHMISIDKMLKLYQGEGHKVKGQGYVCIYGYFFVSAINHGLMNGS